MPRTGLLAIIALAFLPLAPSAASAEPLPKQIEMAVQAGAKVVTTFSAASQLKGWVLSRDGQYTMVYSTPDGKTLLVGELIDESGNSLGEQYLAKYVPRPDPAALFDEVERSRYIVEGSLKSPKSVVYVLFDPNCPFCHLAWKAFQAYQRVGLQVRWIPVAYLMETSAGKAAAIMEAKDTRAALRENEEKYDLQRHQGGIREIAKPGASALRQLRANGELMHKLGASGTPALIWKDPRGEVHLKVGLPRLSELPSITELPEQAENDPALARFR